MKPHSFVVATACATGLLLGLWGCGWFESDPEPEDILLPGECKELIDGGTLDCVGEDSSPCEVMLNRCTYYRLGKYSIVLDLCDGTVYRFSFEMSKYDDKIPARRDFQQATELSIGPAVYFDRKSLRQISYLIRSVCLRINIFDTEEETWSYPYFYLYRALVSPEVRYADTVWGKLRMQGYGIRYAWHVLSPGDRLDQYLDRVDIDRDWRKFQHYWNPDDSDMVDWLPGEKEALDALTEDISLSLPLVDSLDAYDLKFTLNGLYSLCCFDESNLEALPDHLAKAFREVDTSLEDEEGGGLLRFKIRKR